MMTSEQMIYMAPYCPNGHRPVVNYTHARLRELLDSGTLKFHCKECCMDFPPTEEESLSLRKLVARP